MIKKKLTFFEVGYNFYQTKGDPLCILKNADCIETRNDAIRIIYKSIQDVWRSVEEPNKMFNIKTLVTSLNHKKTLKYHPTPPKYAVPV